MTLRAADTRRCRPPSSVPTHTRESGDAGHQHAHRHPGDRSGLIVEFKGGGENRFDVAVFTR
jgi:hypothetical protein